MHRIACKWDALRSAQTSLGFCTSMCFKLKVAFVLLPFASVCYYLYKKTGVLLMGLQSKGKAVIRQG
jgi:hypothetical protein